MTRYTPLLMVISMVTGFSQGAAAVVNEDALRESIAQAISARGSWSRDARLHIGDIKAADPALLARARGVIRTELPQGESGHGGVTARLVLDVPGESHAWTWVRTRVRVEVPVLGAKRALPRAEPLVPEDLERTWSTWPTAGTADATKVVGKVLKRSMSRGQIVRTSWLEAPSIVHRGDPVVAVVTRGNLRVRTPARVLERGALGDLIKVKVGATGRIVHGRVLSAETVEVIP